MWLRKATFSVSTFRSKVFMVCLTSGVVTNFFHFISWQTNGIEAMKLAVSGKRLILPYTSSTFAVLGTDENTKVGWGTQLVSFGIDSLAFFTTEESFSSNWMNLVFFTFEDHLQGMQACLGLGCVHLSRCRVFTYVKPTLACLTLLVEKDITQLFRWAGHYTTIRTQKNTYQTHL